MTTDELDKGFMMSLVKSYVIDFLIVEILDEGNIEYSELSYRKKIAVCKLVDKKRNLYGRILA